MMHHRIAQDIHQRKPSNFKIKPGVFSDHANVSNFAFNNEYQNKPKSANQSFESLHHRSHASNQFSKGHNMAYHGEQEMPEMFYNHRRSIDQEYIFEDVDNMQNPLEERTNYPEQNRLLSNRGPHTRSEKNLQASNNAKKSLKRQSSVNYIQSVSASKSQKKGITNRSMIENENSENNVQSQRSGRSQRSGNMSISFNKRRAGLFNEENIEPSSSNSTNRNYYLAAGKAPFEVQGDIDFEAVGKENTELWKNVKRLGSELQQERSRSTMLENDVNSLVTNMKGEREKYQQEFVKISQEIKKFQNIQGIYIKEKRTSQALEQQLNQKEVIIENLSSFLKECLETMMNTLEMIIIKGDVAFESQLKNQEFSPEDLFKLFVELKRPIIQKLEAADKKNFDFEWKSPDYEELLKYNKGLFKQRKNSDFQSVIQSITNAEMSRKSSAAMIPNSNSSRAMIYPPNTNPPNQPAPTARSSSNPRSTCNSFRSFDSSLLAMNPNSKYLKENDHLLMNARVNFSHVQYNNQQQNTEYNYEEEMEKPQSRSFEQKRAAMPRNYSRDFNLKEHLVTTESQDQSSSIPQKISYVVSNTNNTLEDLLQESNTAGGSRNNVDLKTPSEGREGTEGDLSSRRVNYPLIPTRNQNLPLAQSNVAVKKEELDADTIKERIMSRITKIGERRKASNSNINEGIRSFNFDISSIQDTSMTKNYDSLKQPSQNKYLARINLSRGEENLSDNEEAVNTTEKVISVAKPTEHLSVHNISHSTAPKRNLTTYNSNALPDQLNKVIDNGAQEIKESQVISHRICTRDSHVSNDNVSARVETKPNNEPQQESGAPKAQGGFEFVTACYEYKAQKENDLQFKKGDRIQVLRKTENGWWIGLCQGKIGYFPSNFVTASE